MRISELMEASGAFDPEYKKEYIQKTTTVLDQTGKIDKIQNDLSKYAPQIQIAIRKYIDGCPIYRGVKSDDSVMLIDSTAMIRKAAHTDNYFNLLISEILPTWKNYPQRNKSLICTSSLSKAELYYTPYVVLPIGDPFVGICPTDDFWGSFNNGDINPNDFNYNFGNILSYIKEKFNDEPKSDDSSESVKYNFSLIRKHAEDLKNTDIFYHPFKNNANFSLRTLNTVLSPKSNNFELTKLSSMNIIKSKNHYGNEMWLSGTALLIRETIARQIDWSIYI